MRYACKYIVSARLEPAFICLSILNFDHPRITYIDHCPSIFYGGTQIMCNDATSTNAKPNLVKSVAGL